MRLLVPVLLLTVCASAQPPNPNRAISVPEAGANLPAQPVGANDLIAVSVYDAPELSRTVRISGDGFIRLPMLQQRIKAVGSYPAELETAIVKALREEQILVDPFVTVTIAEYHSRPISVAGAVKMPLLFQAEGPTTLLEAIARAQGLREDAGQVILVTQSQPGADGTPVVLTRRINVRGLIDDADPALNVKLTGGEEVRVPEVSKIYIVGNVTKPGAYPVQDGGDTTVLQMLALAEGLTQFAGKQAFIYRREGAGPKTEIAVPLGKIMKRQAPDVPLTANDILYITDRSGKRAALATLEKVLLLGGSMGCCRPDLHALKSENKNHARTKQSSRPPCSGNQWQWQRPWLRPGRPRANHGLSALLCLRRCRARRANRPPLPLSLDPQAPQVENPCLRRGLRRRHRGGLLAPHAHLRIHFHHRYRPPGAARRRRPGRRPHGPQ